MEWVESVVNIIHVLASVALVGLVLLQHGKGADAGAAFGSGASQTVFGSQGSGSFLTTMTTWIAVVFFVTSFSLAVFAKQKAEQLSTAGDVIPALTESSADVSEKTKAVDPKPASSKDEVPALEQAPEPAAPELE